MSSTEPARFLSHEHALAEMMGGIPVDDLAHAQHVADLADQLFHLTWPLHGLGGMEAGLLHRAALLHDAGIVVRYHGHHKESLRIILQSELPGIDDDGRREIAIVARYHRKALPSKSHKIYSQLPREVRQRVDILGGILRLADAFDCTHEGGVLELQGHVLSAVGRSVHVLIRARHSMTDYAVLQQVMRQAHAKRDLFERAFRCRLSISPETVDTKPALNGHRLAMSGYNGLH